MFALLRPLPLPLAGMLALSPALAQQAPHFADERKEGGFDPAARYREGPKYTLRILAPADRVYRGRDGSYYCRRPDGTAGLLTGAIDGYMLGDAIKAGHSRTVGTLVADYVAKIEGQAYDRLNHEIRCR
ncbi:hypothetical protein P1X14_04245 [Sphingomonas sp. AOB5]|uniref:hypothetical protein n=1 Tax=Sphingomonas sp. AOB5 TaxID=3034017 RepID=UPI0023F8A88F|nr:hypothetical protein [Sphingomonas sp. AOB5]MDF7774447.1 hypothetical protein [Sphingomonas sp. AOB5]